MLYLPVNNSATSASHPLLSVVIVIRDRADELKACIASLEAQIDPPPFEVVIVDDGSAIPVHAEWQKNRPGEIRIIRQSPRGIAAARNFGVEMSRGRWIMFTDSDCEVCPKTLRAIADGMDAKEGHIAYQLKLIGDQTSLVQRMEEVRLVATQHATCKPDGRIHYLATGGFVIHGDYARYAQPLFETHNIRSEDSALLAQLTRENNLPVLLSEAVVRHKPRQTTLQYARKHFMIGYRSIAARRALEQTGHKFITGRSRYNMVGTMMRHARTEHIPLIAVVGLLACHMLNRMGRIAGRLSHQEKEAPRPIAALPGPQPSQASAAKSSIR